VQVAEIIRQVQNVVVQQVQKGIPKVQTQVVEKVQAVPATLISEVAQEVPQVQMVEVLKQTAAATSQRIVQTGIQYERHVERESILERVENATISGVYEAGVVGVRENAMVQPTVVERLSPILTSGIVDNMQTGFVSTQAPMIEYVAPMEVMQAAPTMIETMVAPTTYQTMVAPTTMVMETMVAPTTYMAAPTTYM